MPEFHRGTQRRNIIQIPYLLNHAFQLAGKGFLSLFQKIHQFRQRPAVFIGIQRRKSRIFLHIQIQRPASLCHFFPKRQRKPCLSCPPHRGVDSQPLHSLLSERHAESLRRLFRIDIQHLPENLRAGLKLVNRRISVIFPVFFLCQQNHSAQALIF